VIDVELVDLAWVDQSATSQYSIHQFKNYADVPVGHNECLVSWTGQTNNISTPVVLQIYKITSSEYDSALTDYDDSTRQYDQEGLWEDLIQMSATLANVDFVLSASISDLTNYKDIRGVVTCRVYQQEI
jgi:hypothetical protein